MRQVAPQPARAPIAIEAALEHCRKARFKLEEETADMIGEARGVRLELIGSFLVIEGRLERLKAA